MSTDCIVVHKAEESIIQFLDSLFYVGSCLCIKSEQGQLIVNQTKVANVNMMSDEIYLKLSHEKLDEAPNKVNCILINEKAFFDTKVNRYLHPFLILSIPKNLSIIEERVNSRHLLYPSQTAMHVRSLNEAHYGMGHEKSLMCHAYDISLTGISLIILGSDNKLVAEDSIKLATYGDFEFPSHTLGRVVHATKSRNQKQQEYFKVGIQFEKQLDNDIIKSILEQK